MALIAARAAAMCARTMRACIAAVSRPERSRGPAAPVRRLRALSVAQARSVLCNVVEPHAPATAPCHPQHVDTGEVLMQAFADRDAICETLQTG